MLRGREMPPIDTCLVRVITGDTKGGEQDTEYQEFRILPSAHHIGKYSPRVMIDRMPHPPLGRFGSDKAPHFIDFGCAAWREADGAGSCTGRGGPRGGGVGDGRGCFLYWDSVGGGGSELARCCTDR